MSELDFQGQEAGDLLDLLLPLAVVGGFVLFFVIAVVFLVGVFIFLVLPPPSRRKRGGTKRVWSCPICGTVNPPGVKICSSCSAAPLGPAPAEYYFYIAAAVVCGVLAIVTLPTFIGAPIFALLAMAALRAADRSW